jgi:hypothetical protein
MGCVSLYVLIVLFLLFLLVMCICLDLPVFKIWDFGSIAKSRQAKWAKPSQAAAWEALRSVPSHVIKRGCRSVYFGKEVRVDSFAAASSMP